MNGILQEKHGKYYVVLDYKIADGTRKRKWVNTGISVAGNNTRAAKKKLTEILLEYQHLEQYIKKPNSFTEYVKELIRLHGTVITLLFSVIYCRILSRLITA